MDWGEEVMRTMGLFTVEVTTVPVEDDDWGLWHRVIDAAPGTVLLADAEEPVLVFEVQATSPLKAAQFVDGITTLVGLGVLNGTVSPIPDDYFDFEGCEDSAEEVESAAVDVVNQWISETPALPVKMNTAGDLVSC